MRIGYNIVWILPKKDCNNLPFVDDLIINTKGMMKTFQLWMIIVLDLCILQNHPKWKNFNKSQPVL